MIEDLTQAELRLIEAAKRGEVADYSDGNAANNDPAQGASWNGERALRGEMVRQLCLGLNPKWTVDPRGIRILGARIADDLDLSGANITFPFELERCHVAGSLFLRDVMAMRLSFSGSWLVDGLQAGGLVTKGNVFLNGGFAAKGEVRLLGADIGGVLACGQGSFENPDGEALSADGMTVKGDVFLNNGFAAKGQVRFLGADIGGDLACSQGTFETPDGDALSADRMTVKGTVFLNDGFTAKGKVRFAGADIGSNLACSQGTFENPDGEALSADGMTVKGDVFLSNGFTAKGEVRFAGADIGGDLVCRLARFEVTPPLEIRGESAAFSLEGARVKGVLHWREVASLGRVTFAHAKVGGLNDERDSWPTPGSLDLNGFEYSEFASNAPTGSADRIAWLRRQVSFQPQPYEQAIRVLRHLGHDHDARRVAIEKQIALRESGFLNGWGNWWNWFFGVTVSYGYQPWKALIMALGFCIVGAGAFDLGHGYGLISPTDSRVYFREEFVNSQGAWLPPQYPKFNAPIYSVDVFLPIVDLHQESRWLPNMRNNWGWALWLYMWVHILSGWALTSVFVAALTGIIKKD